MISHALRTDIERWASRIDENPVFRLAKRGQLTQAMITRYIASITYLVYRTPGNLVDARDRARDLGDMQLAAHYQHKLDEEDGHAKWGESDLEMLSRMSTRPVVKRHAPAAETIAEYLTSATAEDPALYLSWLAFTEYVTALLGPEFLSLVEERCGVPRAAMTIIDKHVELDRDHAEEGFAVIDDLVSDPRKIAPLRKALAEILALYDRFCAEVVNLGSAELFDYEASAA